MGDVPDPGVYCLAQCAPKTSPCAVALSLQKDAAWGSRNLAIELSCPSKSHREDDVAASLLVTGAALPYGLAPSNTGLYSPPSRVIVLNYKLLPSPACGHDEEHDFYRVSSQFMASLRSRFLN